MADLKISQLPLAISMTGDDLMVLVDDPAGVAITKQIAFNNMEGSLVLQNQSGLLTPNLGGTGTSTAFTSGSIVFAGTLGVYSQDNANLFWDDTNNRIGIGTNVPASVIHGVGGTYNTGFRQESSSVGGTGVGIKNTDVGGTHWILISNGSANAGGAGLLQFWNDTTATTAMMMTSTGAVGIGTLTPTALFHVNGSIAVKRTISPAGNYTALITDHIVSKTGITGGGDTVTLPTAASAKNGFTLIIKDESGSAATNNLTIDGNGAETIDGALTVTITANYGVARLYCDGTSWFTI